MDLPFVSVIIPTYNRLRLLQEAVDSVLSQTYDNFELIIVDDGSTDGTDRWARALGKKAVYTRLAHTGFPGRARNRGAELSRGPYLAFLDSDDLWETEKLELQIGHLTEKNSQRLPGLPLLPPHNRDRTNRPLTDQAPSAQPVNRPLLSHTRERWLRLMPDGKTKEVSQKGQHQRREGDIFEDALKKCIIGPSTVMIERTLFRTLGGFREDLEIAEDYELWLRVVAVVEPVYLDKPLTVKRAGFGEQLSEKYGQIELFRIQGLKDLVDRRWFASSAAAGTARDRLLRNQKAAERELARKLRIHAAGCRKRGREGEARRMEAEASLYEAALHEGAANEDN